MTRMLGLVALVSALAAGAAAPRTDAGPTRATKSPASPVLGISYRSPGGALAWFDPLTLRTLAGRKAPLGGHLGGWAFSADRSVLALGSCGGSGRVEMPGIRVVNARAMRVLGDLQLGSYWDCWSALAWLRPDRLLAVASSSNNPEAVLIDPVARRVLRREPLPSAAWAWGRTRDELFLLLATAGSVAPVRVATVDADGTIRTATVDRVLVGTAIDAASPHARTVSPGLAVDPDRRRAFLVPASGPVAEVDLQTLAVSYHELDRPSLLQRFLRWLTPAAHAKEMEGPIRVARWLGDGIIAVSGMDYSLVAGPGGEPLEVGTPAGVRLIDTRSWTTHMLDHEASSFAVAPGLVVAQGRWDSEHAPVHGLRAFGLDGREWWALDTADWMDPAGSLGYAHTGEQRSVAVVDMTTGTVLASIRRDASLQTWPSLLAAQSSGS